MRDPKRIPEILNLIQQLWEFAPNTRYFQFTEYLAYRFHQVTGSGEEKEIWSYDKHLEIMQQTGITIKMFNVEDDKFIKFLNWELEQAKERGSLS